MMHFLGCLTLLIFAAFFFILAFFGTIVNAILSFLGIKTGIGRRQTTYRWENTDGQGHHGTQQQGQQQRNAGQSQQGHSTGRQTQKIFEKDDSEYVDYEEVR